MEKKTKVVIIGAGAAGIAAASRLLRKGIDDFIVLEATNRIGGRINTVDFADNVVDLGAQWVLGESENVVFELASKYNLLGTFSSLSEPKSHFFITTNSEVIPKEEITEAGNIFYQFLNDARKQFEKEGEGISFADYFTKKYYEFYEKKPFTTRTRAADFLSWMEKLKCSTDSDDTWFNLSVAHFAEYKLCKGDQLFYWKDRGYKTLFDLLLQKIPNEEECLPVMKKVEFKKVVTTINYSGEDVIVSTNDNSQYHASYVIFTASLGVLKDKCITMFKPPLPQKKQRAIKGLNIGTANKIFLEFPHTWWPEDICFDITLSAEEKKKFSQQGYDWLCDVFMIHAVYCQPKVLCAWIIGERAKNVEIFPDDEVLRGMIILLENSIGKHYNVVKPKKILMSRWHTNEHVKGSYSYQNMFTSQDDVRPQDLAEPIKNVNDKPIILFAGEATHDHYYSTVHGAVETGFREADRIIDYEQK